MQPFFQLDQKEYHHLKPAMNAAIIQKEVNFDTKKLTFNCSLN